MLLADIDVPRVDAIFRESARHLGIFFQQQMSVVMEIANDRHAHAEFIQRVDDLRHSLRGVIGIDGDAHQFRAGVGQRHGLIHGRHHVGGVGVGHGLNHNGVRSSNFYFADSRLPPSAVACLQP